MSDYNDDNLYKSPDGGQEPPQDPNGAHQDPNGAYQNPNGAYQDPNGAYQDPNGAYQDPNFGSTRPSRILTAMATTSPDITDIMDTIRGRTRTPTIPFQARGRDSLPKRKAIQWLLPLWY
ncbi:MAG: hypothetical protein ACOX8K_14570 [Lachnospiraceae bacterium]|jgi:hypothetical protein